MRLAHASRCPLQLAAVQHSLMSRGCQDRKIAYPKDMFTVIREMPWEELQRQIQAVHLLEPRGGEYVYPYEHAQILLREVAYSTVRPTSLYLLTENLKLQRQLTEDLKQQGFDPLNLTGLLTVQEDKQPAIGLMPPIVEETVDDGAYLLDGIHRAYLGLLAGKTTFRAIHITGIRPDCPAAVRPNDWQAVRQYDAVPSDPQLKRHYRPEPLRLRRDFSQLNGSTPRHP